MPIKNYRNDRGRIGRNFKVKYIYLFKILFQTIYIKQSVEIVVTVNLFVACALD